MHQRDQEPEALQLGPNTIAARAKALSKRRQHAFPRSDGLILEGPDVVHLLDLVRACVAHAENSWLREPAGSAHVITQASDVLQYAWRKLLGRVKSAPTLAPSKTVEGFLGGILCATALGVLLSWLGPFTILEAAAMAVVIALTGFAGRGSVGHQERPGPQGWSRFVPGHGGMLDRLDSTCLSAPLFFHLTRSLLTIQNRFRHISIRQLLRRKALRTTAILTN